MKDDCHLKTIAAVVSPHLLCNVQVVFITDVWIFCICVAFFVLCLRVLQCVYVTVCTIYPANLWLFYLA